MRELEGSHAGCKLGCRGCITATLPKELPTIFGEVTDALSNEGHAKLECLPRIDTIDGVLPRFKCTERDIYAPLPARLLHREADAQDHLVLRAIWREGKPNSLGGCTLHQSERSNVPVHARAACGPSPWNRGLDFLGSRDLSIR